MTGIQLIQCSDQDLQELKRLALACRAASDDDDAFGLALDEYDQHANPDQVLVLFDKIESAERNAFNSEVAYKAAIEKQGEIRAEREALQQRLNVADQLVDELQSALTEIASNIGGIAGATANWKMREIAENALKKLPGAIAESCQFPQSCTTRCDCDIPDFSPGNGNKARRRAAAIEALKPTESGASE